MKGGHSSLTLLISMPSRVSICVGEAYSPVLSAKVFVYCLKNTVTFLLFFLNIQALMKRLETPITDSALERQLSTETLQRSFSSFWWISIEIFRQGSFFEGILSLWMSFALLVGVLYLHA